LLYQQQALLQIRVDVRLFEHIVDINTLVHQGEMPPRHIPVIAEIGAAAQKQYAGETEKSVHRLNHSFYCAQQTVFSHIPE
jgi:hypothetical protein